MKRSSPIHSAWKKTSRLTRILLVVFIVLVIGRIALPYAIKSYVNRKLNAAAEYGGRIGDVSMRLWQGGYRIHQVEILKRNGKVQSPLFSAREIDLVLDWRELFHGSVAGEVVLHEPHANFVAGPTTDETQTGKDEPWDKMLESLFPFKLNRFEITDGEIHFQDPHSTPPVDIYTSHIFAVATNLTNARDLNDKLPSGVHATASTLGNGRLALDLRMNLLKPVPAYEINCGVTNVNLPALNDFLKAYGKFDVESGVFSLYTSVASDDGKYDGYTKVFFQNLNVFEWEKERKKDILEVFWQAIVGGAAVVFKNHLKDQLATKVPISGNYTNSNVGLWTATGTLLQNAFVHALVPKLDQHVSVDQVSDGKK